jgi:hypothetical protein
MRAVAEQGQDGKAFTTLCPCQVWGKKAEAAAEIEVGTRVLCEGKLTKRRKGDGWQLVVSGFEMTPVLAPALTGSNEDSVMPKKQGPQRVSRWSDLLGRAVHARQAQDWDQVERLLGQLQAAPDAPPAEQPSQELLVWYTLRVAFWEHQAAYWQERALDAADTHLSVAQVEAITRGVLRTLVRRVQDALDAAGAPNPPCTTCATSC